MDTSRNPLCAIPQGKPCPAITNTGRMFADGSWQVPSRGFSGVAWSYFIMKKHKLLARMLLLLEARTCLFWFVAPFTWLNSFICWCLRSCFECVTTSVTSTGYCEIFVKTAFIKPLLNRETETLLLIISCSPVRLSVGYVSWDLLSSKLITSPFESKGVFAVDFAEFLISPLRAIPTFKPGKETSGFFSLRQLSVRVRPQRKQ